MNVEPNPNPPSPADEFQSALEAKVKRIEAFVPLPESELDARLAASKRSSRITESGLPKRALAWLEQHSEAHPSWVQKLAALRNACKVRGATFAIVGEQGRGKTLMATRLGLDYIEKGRRVLYVTLMDISEMYEAARAAAATGQDCEWSSSISVTAHLCAPDLLIIDEAGKGVGTDAETRRLVNVLGHRHKDIKDTILCANSTAESLLEWLGETLARRINETGGAIACDWGRLG